MVTTSTCTIANGATVSDETPVHSSIIGIQMPAAFTGTSLSFQGSADGTTYQPIYDDTGALVTVTVVAGHAVGLDAKALPLASWANIKIVSNAAEGAARVLQLCFKS